MKRQTGFSLIELMISLVIGLVVVGAVFAAYLGTGTSSKASQALSQVTEDASVALNMLRTGVNMVGYGAPMAIDSGKFVKAYKGAGVRGCDGSFTDPDQVTIEGLTCAGGGGSDAIAVAYEADGWNSVRQTGTDVPLDCLGNALADAGGYYLAYNRYYVTDNKLYCHGPVNNSADALVENVEDLQIRYGVANASEPRVVANYRVAGEMNATDFDRTLSIRFCVVIRSTDQVMNEPMTYQGCAGDEPVTAADRRMYRAFTTTVVLQNRLGNVR
jgi:type IV pilus assembly protein PilW